MHCDDPSGEVFAAFQELRIELQVLEEDAGAARHCFERTFGEEYVVEREPSMGGEDFARYGKLDPKTPICMFRVGTVPAAKVKAAKAGGSALPSLHSSKYLPEAKPAIETGVTAMTAAALDLLGK